MLKLPDSSPKAINFILFISTLALTAIIPTFTMLSAWGIQSRIDSVYESGLVDYAKNEKGINLRDRPDIMRDFGLPKRCADYTDNSPDIREVCKLKSDVGNLATFSILTLVFTGMLLLGIVTSGFIGKFNRFLLLVIFRVGLWATQISVAALVIANASLLILTIYWAESWFIGRIHIGLIASLGLVSGLVALKIIIGIFNLSNKAQAQVYGRRVGRVDYPSIWAFIETIAKEAATRFPDHIVVGLDPTFFVTEANVICLDGKLSGRTLYLSLPLCRTLRKKELAAIIGHEFGHFVGRDTMFSKWFYPIYRGSHDTIQSLMDGMSSEGGLQYVALIPSTLVMKFFLNSFAQLENKISRERELAADKLGALIAGKEMMAMSLIKAHAFSQVWTYTQEKMKEALQNGNVLVNASAHFQAVANLMPEEIFKKDLAKKHMFHPTDTHPSLAIRLKELDTDLDVFLNKSFKDFDDSDSAIKIIDNYEIVEKELTEVEHYKMIKNGVVTPPAADLDENSKNTEKAS